MLGGEVTADGGKAVTDSGVYWGLWPIPVTMVSISLGVTAFEAIVPLMTPGAHYVMQAYATNADGDGFGADVIFDTKHTDRNIGAVVAMAAAMRRNR